MAIPPLGAGNGKLDWNKVKLLIEKHLKDVENVDFYIYEPQVKFEQRDNVKISKAKLTPVRAMLLHLFKHYEIVDNSLNLLVSQKLAYFLQRFGEPLRLKYQKGWYGPYSHNLNKVLQAMNGAYINYQAQQISPITKIELIPNKENEIALQLEKLSDNQKEVLEKTTQFIQDFETPFSLELLATVDWILQSHPNYTEEEIKTEIGNWTRRKATLIKEHHVKVAYKHLKENLFN